MSDQPPREAVAGLLDAHPGLFVGAAGRLERQVLGDALEAMLVERERALLERVTTTIEARLDERADNEYVRVGLIRKLLAAVRGHRDTTKEAP